VDQKTLTLERQINGVQFYKYPYLDVAIATNPSTAIQDLWKAWNIQILSQNDAAAFLQCIVDRSRSIGLQIFLYVKFLERLPKAHSRLTEAILSLQKEGDIYSNPSSGSIYSPDRLDHLIGLTK